MKKKILIIEDEEELLSLLEKRLGQEGYEVATAKDGKEGLTKIKEIKPNLVLLDVVMPVMDGFEVMEAMNKDEEMKKIPFIIISNSGQPVEIDRALKLGAKDYLVKVKFTPQDVLEKIKKQIGNGSKVENLK